MNNAAPTQQTVSFKIPQHVLDNIRRGLPPDTPPNEESVPTSTEDKSVDTSALEKSFIQKYWWVGALLLVGVLGFFTLKSYKE